MEIRSGLPAMAVDVILASASPRRRDLIRRLGVSWMAMPADVDENALTDAFAGPSRDLALYLARHKSAVVVDRLRAVADDPHALVVLAADTTVTLDGRLLGKPRDSSDARDMLARLRDRTHTVTTGVVAVELASGVAHAGAASTPVTMRSYGDDEVAAYIATGDPFDKAGSYALQHPTFAPVARIDGCATNVIGLPLCLVARLLRAAGVPSTSTPLAGSLCGFDLRCTVVPGVEAPRK